jgi:hypothetical protein
LNWLVKNAKIDAYSDDTKIQRYVLATLYYSTNGDSWNDNTGWMTDDDECSWYNDAFESFCNTGGSILELDLYDDITDTGNNLVGTIPNEIALLTNAFGESIHLFPSCAKQNHCLLKLEFISDDSCKE